MTDVIFIAESGASAYGWAKTDSDLDLRLVWAPNWKLAVGLDRKERGKQTLKLALDITKYTIHHYLGLLANKGNGNCLENLFQPKIFEDKRAVKELQELCLENLHIGYLKHWLGYSKSMIHDMEVSARILKRGKLKPILDCYRILNSGIILATNKKVVWNLNEQLEILPSEIARTALEIYLSPLELTKESEEKLRVKAKEEIEILRENLKILIKTCSWNEVNREVFNEWLGSYYKRVRD